MSYGDLERCQERMQYWHEEYNKANKRASAAIAEAKKSKERELTAIRMMLKSKAERDQFEDMLNRIGSLYACAETTRALTSGICEILKELSNG